MALTAEMQRELAARARAANRRIERATEGQRAALEHYTRQYHTRQRDNGMRVFQQGKARTEAEWKARMRELDLFMGTAEDPTISKRSEWERVKKQNVEKAGETLREEGSDITDDELAMILEETEGGSTADFYKALANVEIAKATADEWQPTKENVREAVNARRSAQERATQLIKARAEAKKGRR